VEDRIQLEPTIADTTRSCPPIARVLVVEDFEPFRSLIISIIRDVASLQVIGEAADGLLAIEKARELRPDLILMDIGLPGLNGIESVRRIREFLATSKVVFVSQESSLEIVQEALSLGACGYILKSVAGSELLQAIETVLQGNQYICERLNGRGPQGWNNPNPASK
jgi:DNA-binding NarL/FixJ family response regulator